MLFLYFYDKILAMENFDQNQDSFLSIRNLALTNTVPGAVLLEKFYSELGKTVLKPHILFTVAETYEIIASKLSWPELQQSLMYMLDNYASILLRKESLIPNIINRHPKAINLLFPAIYKKTFDAQYAIPTDIRALFQLIIGANPEDAKKYIGQLCALPLTAMNMALEKFADIYVAKPRIRDFVISKFVAHNNTSTDQGKLRLFSFLMQVVQSDTPRIKTCLGAINKFINMSVVHKIVIQMLGYIYQNYPDYQPNVRQLFDKLKGQNLDLADRRVIARTLNEKETLRSSVKFGHRVPKTAENKYGYESVEHIPIEKPCVMVFAGTGADDPKSINYYMSSLESLLRYNGMGAEMVDIYGAVYNFGNYNDNDAFHDNIARFMQMIKYHRVPKVAGRLFNPSQDDIDPQYIHQIFNRVFLPRIANNGMRLPLDVACHNIRNITVVAHCHGAYTFLKNEELMWEKMRELGYTQSEMNTIQKHLLCVAYAPHCPLGVSKSTMISFASAYDLLVDHNNNFHKYAKEIRKQGLFKPAWFPDQRGNIFIVPDVRTGERPDDHLMLVYNPNAQREIAKHEFVDEYTANGKILVKFIGNTIVNGVVGSIIGGPILQPKFLLSGCSPEGLAIFDQSVKDGEDIYANILYRISQQRIQGRSY